MRFLRGVALSLVAALVSAEEDFTVTVTNYVTAPCFASAIKSVDNGKAAALGIPVVLVWGDAHNSADVAASPTAPHAHSAAATLAANEEEQTYTVTDYTTEYQTTYVPCSVTEYVTTETTITTCYDYMCKEVVTTTLCPTVYATSVKSIIAVSSLVTTESVSTKTHSTTTATGGTVAGAAESDVSGGVHKCNVCKVLTLVLTCKVTSTSLIFEASHTPALPVVASSYTPVPKTASNPVFSELPVTTGSVISASSSFDVSSLFSSASSSGSAWSTEAAAGAGLVATGGVTGGATGGASLVDPYGASLVASGGASLVAPGGASLNTALTSGISSSSATGDASLFRYYNSSLALSSSSSVLSSSLSSLISSSVSTLSASLSSSVSSLSASLSGLISSSFSSSSVSLASSLSSLSSSSVASVESTLTLTSIPTCHAVADLFAPISNENPRNYFPAGQLPVTIPNGVTNNIPIETNKFYANLFLGNQDNMAWTFPYGVFWDKSTRFGLGVLHTDVNLRTFGPTNSNGAASYYFNVPLLEELVFSATSFSASNIAMQVNQMTEFSARVTMSDGLSPSNFIEFPLVKGMGFVTAIYHGGLSVRISSIYSFTSLTKETTTSNTLVLYRVTLNSGTQWLLFVKLPSSSSNFELSISNNVITGSGSLDGVIIQAAVAPSDSSLEAYYLASAGTYVTTAKVTGSLLCTAALYSFDYTTAGSSVANKPLLFALPHHLEALDGNTLNAATGISLDSTTKGKMYAFLTSSLTFKETINNNIQWLPWREDFGNSIKYTATQLNKIHAAAVSELNGVDVAASILLLQSLYYMGKLVDKYAYILLVLSDIVKDETLTNSLLSALKSFFSRLSLNNIAYPLMYDTTFGGVTTTANNNGDTNAEFGSGYYNDHHFHYGYHIHAAAIVGYVDKKLGGNWAQQNKGWVNALIRDVANPSTNDQFFPVSRMFDWYHGHSYAKGLFESQDGKDEESSSEDYNFSYGMKLWGSVIGDTAMEGRGDLMLKIQSRSLNLYFLYSNDNDVEPSNFIANKVSGIYFENKIDYTTYFGTNPEYIHGIHMMPITPASSLIRGAQFVSQEWSAIISGIISSVNSGWTGVLRLNQALFDGTSAYSFFTSSSFTSNYLDGGQSLTWSLAYSAAIANGP